MHVRFGEERWGNSSTTPCLLLYSGWSVDLPILWRSSTGTAVKCCPGASATVWMPRSASIAWKTPCASTAGRKSSIAIRARSSQATPLKREDVSISMDGRGRTLDNIFVERLLRNVKYEDVYLKGYATKGDLTIGLTQYFALYNAERPHQSLGYKTPYEVCASGQGGGAAGRRGGGAAGR